MKAPERLREIADSLGIDSRAGDIRGAADDMLRLELALHQIAGHGNITGDRARKIAKEALGEDESA